MNDFLSSHFELFEIKKRNFGFFVMCTTHTEQLRHEKNKILRKEEEEEEEEIPTDKC